MPEIFGVPYTLIPSKKRKRSIGFRINQDGLEVRTPFLYDEKNILLVLEKRKNWILTNWDKTQKKSEKPSIESGLKEGYILLFGEKSSFEIISNTGKVSFLFDGEILKIYSPLNTEKIQESLKKWYKKQALIYLPERTKELAKMHHFNQLENIFIKNYRAKYAMCKGKDIYLDYKIISLPKTVIDHIILHELSHLIYKHHKASFRNKLAQLDSNWKVHRDLLRGKIDE